MAKYELVREIENNCSRNQMRDVFFSEVQTDDPAAYVRGVVKGKDVELECLWQEDGSCDILVRSSGIFQKFLFTRLEP